MGMTGKQLIQGKEQEQKGVGRQGWNRTSKFYFTDLWKCTVFI